MTGPEHYREAENKLDTATTIDTGSPTEAYLLAAAQVHATLALAAATAMGLDLHQPAWIGWQEVAS